MARVRHLKLSSLRKQGPQRGRGCAHRGAAASRFWCSGHRLRQQATTVVMGPCSRAQLRTRQGRQSEAARMAGSEIRGRPLRAGHTQPSSPAKSGQSRLRGAVDGGAGNRQPALVPPGGGTGLRLGSSKRSVNGAPVAFRELARFDRMPGMDG
jgi:hypothetical protein